MDARRQTFKRSRDTQIVDRALEGLRHSVARVTLPSMIALRCGTALAIATSMLCLACSSGTAGGPRTSAGGAGNTAGASQPGSAGGAVAAGSGGGGTGGVASTPGGAGGAGDAGGGGAMGGASGGVSGGSVGGGGAGGAGGTATLEPCAEPSVSRLKVWEMQVVGGSQVPASGSPLREVPGGGHELYVEWTLNGGGYGTANAPLENQGEYTNDATPGDHPVDISMGPGITLEYASTGNTYMQIRTASVPHGGDHFRADLPSTNGELETITIPLDSFRRPGGSTAPGADVLTAAFSFTLVGGGTTQLTLRQVLIPGFVPPCD
jgi:hypothetical protein